MIDEAPKRMQEKIVHEGLNHFSCDMCEETFFEESLLNEHIIATHLKTSKNQMKGPTESNQESIPMNNYDRKNPDDNDRTSVPSNLE